MPEKPHTGQRLNGPHWYRKSSGRWWRLLRRFGLASAHDGPTMPERIEVAGAEDLMPMDMLEEGRTIRSIRFGAGRSIETATVRRGHEHLDDGTFYWLPIWSDHRDEPYPDFPVTVLRGAPIPEAPCEICAAKTSSHDRGDGA